MEYNTRTERCSTVLAKKSNRNIRSCCQRNRLHVARVCTRRARACGMTAVAVCSASGYIFRIAYDALETQCLYETWTPKCACGHRTLNRDTESENRDISRFFVRFLRSGHMIVIGNHCCNKNVRNNDDNNSNNLNNWNKKDCPLGTQTEAII